MTNQDEKIEELNRIIDNLKAHIEELQYEIMDLVECQD